MKFRKGDRVRVVGDILRKYQRYIGKVGVVDEVNEHFTFPYLVRFEDADPLDFCEEELEWADPSKVVVTVTLPSTHESYEIVVDAGEGWRERVYDELKRINEEGR